MKKSVKLSVSDVCTSPIILAPDSNIYEAINLMLKHKASRVVIARDNKPIGIITEKDLIRILHQDVKKKWIDETRLHEVMTKNPIPVDKRSDLIRCARIMLNKGISSLVVTENHSDVYGIVTKSDFTNIYANYCLGIHPSRCLHEQECFNSETYRKHPTSSFTIR